MKSMFTLISILLIINNFVSRAQHVSKPSDPFCQMIRTIYSLDALRFNSQFSMKQIFEEDTITSYAHVIVKKTGTDISFLQIIPVAGSEELLFCNDSAWIVNHEMLRMDCIGNSIEHMAYNEMSSYFSFTLFSVDTLISRIEPYWKIIDMNDDYTIISLDIAQSSTDISAVRAEFTIGKKDFLPCKTLQESTYMKADKIFQEQIFSNYSFPDPEQVKIPDYFMVYEKDLAMIKSMDSLAHIAPEEYQEDVKLHGIRLVDFSGKVMELPDKGLVFFDLWYVGCAPCMKSAPIIEKIYHKYSGDLHFISINETDHDTLKIRRFKDKMGISFPVVLGEKGAIAMKVTGRNAYPVFVLLDASSRNVLWKLTGYSDNLEELIIEAIEDHL